MITQGTRKEVYDRCNGRCQGCGRPTSLLAQAPMPSAAQLHHVYFKSHYRKSDRDEAWNLTILCPQCHDDVHGENTDLRQRLQDVADILKAPEYRSTETISRSKKKKWNTRKFKVSQKERRKKEELYYKETHGGMTPLQVAYERAKTNKKKM